MGTTEQASAPVQCSLDGATGAARDDALARRVAELEAELAQLRPAAAAAEGLAARIEQLREANEHLVLATVNAQALRDDAEAANRRQNEFLAMLAHELRNPLAPISMAATLLARIAEPPPQMVGLVKVVARQVGHMARLLDDLLDAARISSGKITLEIEPLLLSDVLEQAVETVQPRVRERRQQLVLALPEGAVGIRGDRVRLAQVFSNLLGNASKYTGDGGTIRLSAVLDGAGIEVSVQDNGAGMAPETIPHIFDLFTQGPRSLARSEGGLGVGLNVVRNLVTMHGGAVRADSAGPGQGSRFTVSLPGVVAAPAAALAPAAAAAPVQRAVLVIEDNADACAMLAQMLALEGHEVRVAHDGRHGLALALEHRFDVLVCDIGLPELDGLGVVAALRAALAPGPLAIAVSGYCQPEDSRRALAAGFDHYLVKPVSPGALLALLAAPAERAAPACQAARVMSYTDTSIPSQDSSAL